MIVFSHCSNVLFYFDHSFIIQFKVIFYVSNRNRAFLFDWFRYMVLSVIVYLLDSWTETFVWWALQYVKPLIGNHSHPLENASKLNLRRDVLVKLLFSSSRMNIHAQSSVGLNNVWLHTNKLNAVWHHQTEPSLWLKRSWLHASISCQLTPPYHYHHNALPSCVSVLGVGCRVHIGVFVSTCVGRVARFVYIWVHERHSKSDTQNCVCLWLIHLNLTPNRPSIQSVIYYLNEKQSEQNIDMTVKIFT